MLITPSFKKSLIVEQFQGNHLKQFIRHKLWCPPNCVPFRLFNYPSLSLHQIVLALSSAVTNLSHKTLIFHDFQGLTIKFHDFPGLDNQILKFHDFPGFP